MSDKHQNFPNSNKCIDSDDEDIYRNLPIQSDVTIDKNPNLDDPDLDSNEVQLPKKKRSYENLFESFDVASMSQLPPIPKYDENMNPLDNIPKKQKVTIPCETKLPIKSYTNINCVSSLSSDNEKDRIRVMDVITSILNESLKLSYKMLQNDLKLRGDYCDPEKPDLDGSRGTSLSFTFQLFKSKKNDKNILGVFRRLCGDVILYNDIYRDIVQKSVVLNCIAL